MIRGHPQLGLPQKSLYAWWRCHRSHCRYWKWVRIYIQLPKMKKGMVWEKWRNGLPRRGEGRTVPPTPQPQTQRITNYRRYGSPDKSSRVMQSRVDLATSEEGPDRETFAGPGDIDTQREYIGTYTIWTPQDRGCVTPYA